MPIDDYRASLGSLWQGLRARVAGWCKPTHPRFPLHLFLLALGVGLLLGLAWLAKHRIVLALRTPTATLVASSGPGAPLPTPMADGNGALPMAGTAASSLARIEDSVPSASAATMQQSADTFPTTTNLQDSPPLPTQPADSMIPDQRDDGMQALPADDPAQPAHSAQPREATVSVQIDEQGNPLQVSVQRSSGSATFDNAALLQVRARHFPPTLRDGEPVPATLSVSVSAPSASH